MSAIFDGIKLVLELHDRKKSKPDLRVDINKIHFSSKFKFIGLDIIVTNISSSAFSISNFRFNGIEAILSPYIWDRGDGRRVIRAYENESRKPMRVLYDIDLPRKDPLPSTPYLKTNMSIDGLIFWDWETSIKRELEISTIILSSNKEISALIPLTNK